MCPKRVTASASKSLNFFLLDYRIMITMKFFSFGESCISIIISVSQIVIRGKQENTLSAE